MVKRILLRTIGNTIAFACSVVFAIHFTYNTRCRQENRRWRIIVELAINNLIACLMSMGSLSFALIDPILCELWPCFEGAYIYTCFILYLNRVIFAFFSLNSPTRTRIYTFTMILHWIIVSGSGFILATGAPLADELLHDELQYSCRLARVRNGIMGHISFYVLFLIVIVSMIASCVALCIGLTGYKQTIAKEDEVKVSKPNKLLKIVLGQYALDCMCISLDMIDMLFDGNELSKPRFFFTLITRTFSVYLSILILIRVLKRKTLLKDQLPQHGGVIHVSGNHNLLVNVVDCSNERAQGE